MKRAKLKNPDTDHPVLNKEARKIRKLIKLAKSKTVDKKYTLD